MQAGDQNLSYKLEYKIISQRIKWTGTYSPGYKHNNNAYEKLRADRIPKLISNSQFTPGLLKTYEINGLSQSNSFCFVNRENRKVSHNFFSKAKIHDNDDCIMQQICEVKL